MTEDQHTRETPCHDDNIMTGRRRVLILGGGFGGLSAARALSRINAEITLIDKNNYHLFQPLLYQVATGGLSPADIASPLRGVLKKRKNVRTLMLEVTAIDKENREVICSDQRIPYDILIVATGAENQYFGHDSWRAIAPGLKTLDDALEIRTRIFTAFEKAELEQDEQLRKSLLTFVIIGGGPTGVELAGAVAEIARDTLKHDFRSIDPTSARILLVERGERILAAFSPGLSVKATESLERLGVEVSTGHSVTSIVSDRIVISAGTKETKLTAGTILWASGTRASALGAVLAGEEKQELLDYQGRVVVLPDLTLPDYPEIFVIGDLASFSHQTGEALPGLAPVAISQGQYVARVIAARIAGQPSPGRYKYRDRGILATIGRTAAVVDFPKLRFSGFFAWLAWLFIHLMQLCELDNRLLVMIQWAWNYFTRNRGARLITKGQATEL